MKPKLAAKVRLVTVCKGESSVGYMIDCFGDISSEEHCFSEDKSRSNVSGTHIKMKETSVIKLAGTL